MNVWTKDRECFWVKSISSKNLKPMLTAEAEIAFLDVREFGQYGEGHPFFSVHVGYSTIEVEVRLLVPRRAIVTTTLTTLEL